MIKTFADKTTAALFDNRPVRSVAKPLRRKARRKPVQIDAVDSVEALALPPGNGREKLGGNRAGQWGIRVEARWRNGFRFKVGAAWDVEFCDYP